MSEANLKIRVVMKEPALAESSPVVNEYAYRWERIVPLLLLLIVVGFFVFRGFSGQVSVMPSAAEQDIPPADKTVDFENDASVADQPTLLSASINNDQATAVIAAEKTETVEKSINENTDKAVSESVTIVTSEKVALAPETIPQSKSVLGGEKTRIHSSTVKRFMISAGVKQREPVGDIGDIIVDANQIATVYVYSEVHGLKDRHLVYLWKHNQKELARVEVGVWGNLWRSYSRKYLNQKMRGDFIVELRTAEGELLAETAFQFN